MGVDEQQGIHFSQIANERLNMKKRFTMCATVCLMLVFVVDFAMAGKKDGRLEIYWVDVEGGAATLIITHAGESILIDTGNPGHRDPDRIVAAATKIAGLRRIDYLITTHYHRDHYGGAATLATMIPIGTVYDNGTFEGMPDNPGKAYFEFPCEKRVVIQPGDQLPLKQVDLAPRLTLTCLAARKTFAKPSDRATDNPDAAIKHRPKKRDGSDNANSVAMLLEFGDFQFFDGGDLTWNQEFHLVSPKNLIGEIDVYQVSHHGLDSSNNPVLVHAVQPRVAVMNNGVRKGCMPEVFATLTGTPSIEAIYQVHKNRRDDGVMNNAPDEYIANRGEDQDCKGHHVQLSVAADAAEYTLRIPANDHQRVFKTK